MISNHWLQRKGRVQSGEPDSITRVLVSAGHSLVWDKQAANKGNLLNSHFNYADLIRCIKGKTKVKRYDKCTVPKVHIWNPKKNVWQWGLGDGRGVCSWSECDSKKDRRVEGEVAGRVPGWEGQRQIRLSACCLPLPLLKPESRFATATATCQTRVLVCHNFLQRLISTVHWYNFCKFMRDKILWQLVHLNFNCKLKFEIALTFFRIEGLISKFFLDFCTERNMTKVWWGRG